MSLGQSEGQPNNVIPFRGRGSSGDQAVRTGNPRPELTSKDLTKTPRKEKHTAPQRMGRRSFLRLGFGSAVALLMGVGAARKDVRDLGIKSNPDPDHSTSLGAAKNIAGDGLGMIAEGVKSSVLEGADRLADRFRQGIDQDPMMGQEQYDGARFLVKFDTSIKEMPVVVRTGPSTADRELTPEEIAEFNLNLEEGVEGVFVSGGTYPLPSGHEFVDSNNNDHGEWLRVSVKDSKTGKLVNRYIGTALERERIRIEEKAVSR